MAESTPNLNMTLPDVGDSGWGTTLNSNATLVDNEFHGTTGHDHTGATGKGPHIDLTDAVTGILPSANGGTGSSSDKFHASTGHTHNGSSGQGPLLNLTAAVTGILPIANGGSGQSAIHAVALRHSTTQSIANDAAYHNIVFDTERFDVGGLHSIVSNTDRMTAQIDGIYMIAGQVRFTDDTTGTYRLLSVILDDTTDLGGVERAQRPSGSTVGRMNVALIYPLTAGQYVTLAFQHNMTANATINTPFFGMFRVGPTS